MGAGTLLETATAYQVERGWNVIPLARDEKTPIAGFPLETFFNRRMKDSEMREWFNHPQVGNIGVLAGPTSGIWVADIDDVSLVEDWRTRYPTDLMSRTPSGGLHLFYEYPQDGDVPNGHIGNGVDIISRNKYVLVSPSFVKKAGHGGKTVSGSYEWLKYGKPTPAQDALLRVAMLGGSTGNGSEGIEPGRFTNISRAEAIELLSYAMRTGRFVEGRHNETIYFGALILSSNGMPTELITEMMLGLDRRDPTPQGDRAVRAAIHNAVKVADKRREEDELSGYRIVINEAHPPAGAAKAGVSETVQQAKPAFATMTYEQATQEYEDYVTRWLVEGFLLEESVMMVAAPPERFKTWFTADLAVSVATGGLFLGQFPVGRTGDVLVVQQEDFGARLINRYNKIEQSKTRYMDTPGFKAEPLPDGSGYKLITEYNPNFNTIHFHTDGALKLDDPKSLEAFKAKVREVKPVLVVIDPFYSLSNKTDDYYASLADTIRKHIKELRNEVGCAVVFVHHTGKGNAKDGEDPTNRQGAWGSQFINAVMEGMIMMARGKGMGENSVSVYRRFKDAPAQPVIDLTFNIREGGDIEYGVELNTASSLENEIKLYLLEQGPTKLQDLYEEFADRFPSKPQLTNWLKDVDGIVKQQRGIYALSPDVQLEV